LPNTRKGLYITIKLIDKVKFANQFLTIKKHRPLKTVLFRKFN